MTCFVRNYLISKTELQTSPMVSISDFCLLTVPNHRNLHQCITLVGTLQLVKKRSHLQFSILLGLAAQLIHYKRLWFYHISVLMRKQVNQNLFFPNLQNLSLQKGKPTWFRLSKICPSIGEGIFASLMAAPSITKLASLVSDSVISVIITSSFGGLLLSITDLAILQKWYLKHGVSSSTLPVLRLDGYFKAESLNN